MTRETRLSLILVGFAAAGVTALGFAAHQYERALAPRAPETPVPAAADLHPDLGAAAPMVDAFVAVRRAEAAAAERLGVKAEDRSFSDEQLAACRVTRLSEGARQGIDGATYARLSDAWRAWSRGERIEPGLAAAFEARRPATSREALGRYEALDLAVKP
jgi:hypothetical protein